MAGIQFQAQVLGISPLTSGMALGHPVYHPKLTTHLQWHEKESGEAKFSARMVL
jgi:hypothetical protein